MRSLYGPDQLLLASKKPRIKALIEQAKSMSDEEIRSLSEKPDVIKGLLLIKKFGTHKGTIAEKIAELMQQNFNPPSLEIFKIYQYTGETRWIKSGKTFLEMKEGWYWGKLQNNKIIVSSNQLSMSDSDRNFIEQHSTYIKSGTLYDMGDLEKSRLSKLL